MLGSHAVLLGISLLLQAEPGTKSGFEETFRAAAEGRLVIPPGVERQAQRFRYVFVAGFHNERMPGYFSQGIKELRARGVPREAIHIIAPSSHLSIEENADDVRAQFLEAADRGPERLVVIAHSRGACDALAFALQNDEFVRDRVEALFLVQGPFGGSGVADYLAGEGPPMDRQMPLRYRAVTHVLGRLEVKRLHQGKHAGLLGMTRQASQDFWDQTLEQHASAIPIVGPKTFYVTTETEPSRLRLFKRTTGWYLQTYFGPNDGLVSPDDQFLPVVGQVVAVLDAGHGDLTNRHPASRGSRQLRKALIQSILIEVARSGGPGKGTARE